MVLREDIVQGLKLLGKQYSLKQIILFGSRARGDCWERSDIDIAIKGIADCVALADFIHDVNYKIPTLLMWDVVNLDSDMVSPSLFLDIQKEGIIIYEESDALHCL